MPTDAGSTIFAIARIAGWTAHYQEELTERPLRFRARGRLQRLRINPAAQGAPFGRSASLQPNASLRAKSRP